MIPTTGVHFGIPARTYFSWQAVSKSALWRLRESPAHVQHPVETTDAMIFGSAFDCYVTEPELFKKNYAVAGACSAKTGKGASCTRNGSACYGGEWFCFQHTPDSGERDTRDVISVDDAHRIGCMAACVKTHAIAGQLLANAKRFQPAVVWDDPATGLRCKGRLDLWTAYEGQSTHVDIKVTRSADPRDFERQACDLGYAIQQSHYRDGCRLLDLAAGKPEGYRRVVLIAVESTPEYADHHRVECYELDEVALQDGLKERDYLLARYARCKANDNWPGRSELMRTLCLPEWRHNEIQNLQGVPA